MPDTKPAKNSPMRAPWGDIAPALTAISNTVLFDDIWQRPGLSPRDRNPPDKVATVASLLMGPDGAFITGSDVPIDGGTTATYWFGDGLPA